VAVFVIILAAAEAAVALAIVLNLYRNRTSIDVTGVDSMKN
jgi:NADH:ubiquinone oxidoreductase subunit K